MKDIDDIRRSNLHVLEQEAGGPSEIAKVIGMSPAQFINLRDGAKDSKTGKPRGMRKETARRIEEAVGKPAGWLDIEHLGTLAGVLGTHATQQVSPREPAYEIPQFDTGGAMGGGLVLQDQPGVIQSWKVSPEWLRRNVKGYNSAKNLCIVTGFGDSMRPLFNPGDPLLVDTSINTVDFDSI